MRDYLLRLVTGRAAWRPLPPNIKAREDHSLRAVLWVPVFVVLAWRWRDF